MISYQTGYPYGMYIQHAQRILMGYPYGMSHDASMNRMLDGMYILYHPGDQNHQGLSHWCHARSCYREVKNKLMMFLDEMNCGGIS